MHDFDDSQHDTKYDNVDIKETENPHQSWFLINTISAIRFFGITTSVQYPVLLKKSISYWYRVNITDTVSTSCLGYNSNKSNYTSCRCGKAFPKLNPIPWPQNPRVFIVRRQIAKNVPVKFIPDQYLQNFKNLTHHVGY